MSLTKRLAAEFIGTFWLVFAGCGSAVLAAAFPEVGIGLLGVSLAFGLSVLTMAYAVGGISGGHFNPAVSVGLATANRFAWGDILPYVVAQVAGSIVAAAMLWLVASGKAGFAPGGFASNGFGEHSPGQYSFGAAVAMEVVMTMMFLLVILGATAKRAPAGTAPLAIGFALTLIHLVSIPVTNTSVNPARSTGVALFAEQLGARPALGVLGRAVDRRHPGGPRLSKPARRRIGGSAMARRASAGSGAPALQPAFDGVAGHRACPHRAGIAAGTGEGRGKEHAVESGFGERSDRTTWDVSAAPARNRRSPRRARRDSRGSPAH